MAYLLGHRITWRDFRVYRSHQNLKQKQGKILGFGLFVGSCSTRKPEPSAYGPPKVVQALLHELKIRKTIPHEYDCRST